MKKHYLPLTQQAWLILLWAGLLSQTVWAQPVPDSQFARLGKTLAITTDGGIATTEQITEPNPFNGPSRSGSKVIKYSVQGDRIWQTGFLEGGNFIGGQIQGYNYEVIQVSHIAALSDGGVAVVGRLSLRNGNVVTKISATGVPRLWSDSDLFGFPGRTTFDDLIGTPDGGFLLLATSESLGARTTTYVRKYNADVSVAWTKEIAYPTPNPATPDRSLTKGEAVINTPDGGYLIAGLYIADYNNTTGSLDDLLRQSLERNTAWVAKLDGQGNVSWQKLLNNLPVAPGPNDLAYNVSVDRMLTTTDVTLAADGNGYAFVGAGYPASTRFTSTTRAILELNTDGSFKRARTIVGTTAESFVTVYTGNGGRRYYAVGSRSQNSNNPEISLVNPAPLPLTDLDLFKIEARRTFDGPDDGTVLAIGVAGDGGLVFASSGNQVVKLVPEAATPPPAGSLVLTQPTYNCQTGAITFNTTGGDGSPITYSAPGISRSSATSNSGTVEQGLRNDPKPITITATQNSNTVSYTFDFGAFCNGTQPPVNPPTPPTPPTGDALALLAPTYDCASGALTFRTSGGNGSPIEYMAPGITGWTTNPNQFVDRDSRTANDVKPFTLMARQNGVTVSYVWDLKAACGRSQARLCAGERVSELNVSVLSNPVRDAVTVEIRGVESQPLTLRLLDMRGRLVESRFVERAGATEQQIFDVAQQGPGVLLLRAISGTQTKTVKILKQ